MASKPTVRAIKEKVSELLILSWHYERYKALEKEVKQDMLDLDLKDIDIGDAGRVFIRRTERMTISTALASEVLGVDLGRKVIVTKESVSNEIVAAFLKAGDISEELHQALLDRAERKEVVNLYVRPLK